MRMNDKGFGTIEILLIVTVLVIIGFVGYRAFGFYTDRPETGAEQSKYEFKKDLKYYEIVEIPRLAVRCDALGPICNSDPIVLKDPNGNQKQYKFYGEVRTEKGKELEFYRDLQVGDKIQIRENEIQDEGKYIVTIITAE